MMPLLTTTAVRLLAALALLAAAQPAGATAFIVSVGGNSPPAFSPTSIAIQPGDSVVFVNKGGYHNVVADDGSFRCARGCMGDAKGDTGAPSSANWVVSIPFPEAGTFGYYCESHGAPGTGMFGTIHVVAPPQPAPATGRGMIAALLVAIAGSALIALRPGRRLAKKAARPQFAAPPSPQPLSRQRERG